MTSKLKLKNGRRQIKPLSNKLNETKNTTWKHPREPSHSLGKVKTMKVHHPGKENLKRLAGLLRSLRFERRDVPNVHWREARIVPFSDVLKGWALHWSKWWSGGGTRYERPDEPQEKCSSLALVSTGAQGRPGRIGRSPMKRVVNMGRSTTSRYYTKSMSSCGSQHGLVMCEAGGSLLKSPLRKVENWVSST